MKHGVALYDSLVQAGCPPQVAKQAHQSWEDDVEAILSRVASKDDIQNVIAIVRSELQNQDSRFDLKLKNQSDSLIVRLGTAFAAILAFFGTLAGLIVHFAP